MKDRFLIQYDVLPVSVNNYLRPSAIVKGGKAFVHMYETTEAKDWKKRFISYLKREVKKQNWDMSITSDGHWILECVFIQARTNSDNNNYYKILCDALTGVVTEDDKNVLVQTKRVMYDSKNPRFYALLYKAPYIGIFKDQEQYGQFIENNCSNCKKDSTKCAILRKAKEGRVQPEIGSVSQICEKRKS